MIKGKLGYLSPGRIDQLLVYPQIVPHYYMEDDLIIIFILMMIMSKPVGG